MKKQKKILVSILVFWCLLLSCCTVFATDFANYFEKTEFSEEFLEYLELSDEEKENRIMPRSYDVLKTSTSVTNPLKLARMLGSTSTSKYSLRSIIPENMVIKNQQQTGSCWTFASLAALESNMALKDYKNGKNPVVYDFSERHMEYATSYTFKNGVTNKNGFYREVGSGGNYNLSIPYLTNGTGAIAETEMPFENNEDKIYITDIQGKNVSTQVNDAITFPSYESTDDKTEIIQQMKNHIKNYGAIDASIHGASIDPDSKVYNNETGAIYCNSSSSYPPNHAIAIIGWNDTYSTENFVQGNRPTNNGAWIIKNSWGTEMKVTLLEAKEVLYQYAISQGIDMGWSSVNDVPDEMAIQLIEDSGYTYNAQTKEGVLKIGDDGFMYVSYEDANIYLQMSGIIDAQAEVEYENIYQYNEFGANAYFGLKGSKAYIATVFNKQTTGKEYLTQVSVEAPEAYTCKVYVNPNGTSKTKSDLQLVQLETGESETFDAGYHTIEFLNPIKINSNNYVVVLEIQGTQNSSISILQEVNLKDYGYSTIWNNVTSQSGKCFISVDESLAETNWMDTSKLYSLSNGYALNGDTTIKAFTTSKVLESISIVTPPTKTSYIKGQDFDATGMVVKANYANGESPVITDYTIQNGNDLSVGQTSVTIAYKGKTATQNISVKENTVTKISIKTAPTKTEYWAGENFDKNGMVVEATFTDGTTKTVTDYTIQNGTNLKNGQTTVTIQYEGKTATQAITVKANLIEKLEITKAPNKVNYVAGQNFDVTGMVVKATYKNGLVKEVTDYTISDGKDLKEGQTTVTIVYEEKTVTQAITVVAKTITSISVKTMPTKIQYIQNKEELDLTGGSIEISYNDGTKEDLSMTSEEITVSGFNSEILGKQTITLTYEGKTTQFEIEVKELPKPENSNFDNMKGNVTKVRAYYFTDINKKEYSIINIELSNIIKATVNDNIEYYYYLSSNQQETAIENWVKINDLKESGEQMSFEINTSDISNYEEVAEAENLYLYIKEVATRNNMKSEVVTTSVLLEAENKNIEEYIDGELKEVAKPGIGSTPGEEDNTLAQGTIPKAGKSLLIICLIFVIVIIGRISYLKYKDIQIK